MAEVVVTPSGPGAMESGLMVDEAGRRFVVLTFKEPDADPVIVTFSPELFEPYVKHLNDVAAAARNEANWQVG